MPDENLQILREKLEGIKEAGWIANGRPGNTGGVGNTLEDQLGIAENNQRLPDFGEWEIKSQRATTGSLLTLFHCEPHPRNANIVSRVLLPKYGWPHREAGRGYPAGERSFRQTISTGEYSDRGFRVDIDRGERQISISFNYSAINDRHSEWRVSVSEHAGVGALSPVPYWSFDDIEEELNTKLKNLMYVEAETKREGDREFFKYNRIEVYVDPTIEKFLSLLDQGVIYVDFDARTGHNHGTKFRIKPERKSDLYRQHLDIE
jgi:hypothetical protein